MSPLPWAHSSVHDAAQCIGAAAVLPIASCLLSDLADPARSRHIAHFAVTLLVCSRKVDSTRFLNLAQQSAECNCMQRSLHTIVATSQSKQCTSWDQYDRRPELTRDKKNYLFAEVCIQRRGSHLSTSAAEWVCRLRSTPVFCSARVQPPTGGGHHSQTVCLVQNTRSEDTLFMRFPRRAKDVDVRA